MQRVDKLMVEHHATL